MGHEEAKLTILIPSIGRENVDQLLKAITEDADRSSYGVKVIIALNGHREFKLDHPRVEIQDLGEEQIGFSSAINEVIPFVTTPYVCIVADDDIWKMGKIDHDILALRRSDVVLSSFYFEDNLGRSKRPKQLYLGQQFPSRFLYERFSFFRSKRFISISGVCLKTEVLRELPFNTNMFVREDIEWLDRIYDCALQIEQYSTITMGLSVDLIRAQGRENARTFLEWANRLDYCYGNVFSLNFLSGAALKPYIAINDLAMIGIVREVAKEVLSKQNYLVFTLRIACWFLFKGLISKIRYSRLNSPS